MQDTQAICWGILALESVRTNFVVIGEDLGTVTGEVRAALYHAGVLSYRVLWLKRDGAGNIGRMISISRARWCARLHRLQTLRLFRR